MGRMVGRSVGYQIRLYDVSTFQAFVSPDTSAHHFGSVNQVRWSVTGQQYVSCAKDGHIKVWDGVSNRCALTIRNAHGGSEVSSVAFSSSGKYVLSGGKDSMVRLWDVGTGKQVMYYAGAHQQVTTPCTTPHPALLPFCPSAQRWHSIPTLLGRRCVGCCRNTACKAHSITRKISCFRRMRTRATLWCGYVFACFASVLETAPHSRCLMSGHTHR